MTKQYDADFKLNTVKLVLEEGKVASQVARDLGISQKTVYGWVAQYKNNPKHPFVGSGNLKPDAQTTRDLERENRELREELEILKKKKSGAHLQQRPEVSGSKDGGQHHARERPQESDCAQVQSNPQLEAQSSCL